MNLIELLVGKKVKLTTDVGTTAKLTIKSIEKKTGSEDMEPATRENDWYPNQRHWTKYQVTFTNGYSKDFNSLDSLEII